jgi:hypothetical protein
MLGALYASGTAATIRHAAAEGRTFDGGEPAASDVWAYILDRAERCPLAWCFLLWALVQEAIQVVQDSASDRDWEGQEAVQPLLLLLCVATHAPQYSRHLPEAMLRHECLSTAEKAIFVNHLAYQKTKGGDVVTADLSVEMMNKVPLNPVASLSRKATLSFSLSL